MWLLAYWWQFLILLILYYFLYQIYKEMKKSNMTLPAAFLLIIDPLSQTLDFLQDDIIILYPQDTLEVEGDKVYIQNGKYFLNSKSNTSKEIAPGEIFNFAGGSLKLVRWNNARQFLNRNRIGTES